MPLHHGRTVKGIRSAIHQNIRIERHLHVPQKQAIAIAYSMARKDAGKAHISPRKIYPSMGRKRP